MKNNPSPPPRLPPGAALPSPVGTPFPPLLLKARKGGGRVCQLLPPLARLRVGVQRAPKGTARLASVVVAVAADNVVFVGL